MDAASSRRLGSFHVSPQGTRVSFRGHPGLPPASVPFLQATPGQAGEESCALAALIPRWPPESETLDPWNARRCFANDTIGVAQHAALHLAKMSDQMRHEPSVSIGRRVPF